MPAVNIYITSMRVVPHLWARTIASRSCWERSDGRQWAEKNDSNGNWKKWEADDIYYVILARCSSIGAPSRLTWIYFLYCISRIFHVYLCVACLLSLYIGKNARLTLPSIIANQPLAFIIHSECSITAWNFRFNLPSMSGSVTSVLAYRAVVN